MSFKVEVRLPDSPTNRQNHPSGSDLSILRGNCWMTTFLANKSERQAVIRALQDFDRKKPRKTAALSEEKK